MSPNQTTPIGVRIAIETKEALARAAKDDRRSLASMTDKILTDWLAANGYIEIKTRPGALSSAEDSSSSQR